MYSTPSDTVMLRMPAASFCSVACAFSSPAEEEALAGAPASSSSGCRKVPSRRVTGCPSMVLGVTTSASLPVYFVSVALPSSSNSYS